MPRAAADMGSGRVLTSPAPEELATLPSTGKREHVGNEDNEEELPLIKKQKVTTNAFALMMAGARCKSRSDKPSSSNGDGGVDQASVQRVEESTKKPKRGINTTLQPISDVVEMFEDMIARLNPIALKNTPFKLTVATLCSGTDAPIFALGLIQAGLQALGYGSGIETQHVFSCEIEPYKQGFIRRNLPPGTIIFRDVVELATSKGQATTAAGSKASIPAEKLDILFAGCSCVDYSNMNVNKPTGRVPSLDRHLKQKTKRRSGRGNALGDFESPRPVKLHQEFIDDLDSGLDELLRLPSGGESARTFFAAVKLIARTRPKVVILENVLGAPWDMYTRQIFPMLEYVARWVRLDSKEFYLPQTRVRGYLVAVDAMSIGQEAATSIATRWEAKISHCKRAPSAPISAYLRAPDDPATVQARADMESKPPAAAEWNLCSIRHATVRQKHGLRRDENPVSMKAMRNGRIIFANFPSHSWMRFWDIQVTRIPDLLDIVFAIALQGRVDLGYKTGMIDVSQNVDRTEFTRPGASKTMAMKNLGIVGCITPTGLPVVTDLLRPITGTEALALQGLPIDELVISTETQAQLRDLAGNAMTVTVVGAATLALILAVSSTSLDLFDPAATPLPNRGIYIEPPKNESLALGQPDAIRVNAQHLLTICKNMVRICYCPTRVSQVLICNACGTTACPACRGHPKHYFSISGDTVPDCSGEKGKVLLKNILPHILRLSIPLALVHHTLIQANDAVYRAVAYDILSTDPVYYFDEVKLTEAVTVCYKAAHSVARLVFSPGSPCYWYIYVAPWHKDRVNLSAVFDLDQPIARGHAVGDIAIPQWSIWVHGQIDLVLELEKKQEDGPLVANRLVFANGKDVGRDASLLAWKKTVEATVSGTYIHHPNCGTAGGNLWIKQRPTAANKVFMMWDSAGLRDPELDHFVWTDMVRRIEAHEHRETFLHATPSLNWTLEYKKPEVAVFWPGYWSSSKELCAPKLNKQQPDLGSVQIYWGSAEAIQQAACHLESQPPVTNMPVLAILAATFGDFPVAAARLSKIDAQQTGNRFFVIPTTGCDVFLKLFAFISNAVRMPRAPKLLDSFPHLRGIWVSTTPCHDCSVTPPEITVHTREEVKRKTRDETKFTKVIIEDPDQAAQFERQYQDLPRAVAVAARLFRVGGGQSSLEMRIMLQPKTLASRALGYLRQAHRTAACGSIALGLEGKTFFTVTLDYASPANPSFVPFAESVLPCNDALMVGIDRSISFKPPVDEPPRFRHWGLLKDDDGNEYFGWVEHKLLKSQKEAVHWMLRRELAPLDFIKSEVEEEVVAPLNMRVVGKAEWASRFPYSARGGVVAHEIGYGKTVVTLGLIDYQRQYDQTTSIAERMEKVDSAWACELPHPFEHFDAKHQALKSESFFIHLSATLVIVPKHITDQWASEAYKFLGIERPRLLVIKTARWFYDTAKVDLLQQAEIIVVSSSVFADAFMDRLQTLSGRGSDYPKGLSGRSLETWYRRTLRNHRILTAYYLAGKAAGISHARLMGTILKELLPCLVKKEQAELQALVKKQVPEIDRKFYKDMATAKAPRKSDAAAALRQNNDGESSKSTYAASQWNITWLPTFSFARLIWDECSYDDDERIPLVVANIVANSKWLLSGTPKLFGLAEVCNLAASFNIHVARSEPRMMPGLPVLTKGPVLEPMSRSEEFHVFSSRVKSAALARERHAQAQSFVKTFFRANALDEALNITITDEVRRIAMPASTAVCYRLLEQEVLDAGYDYTALPAHARAMVPLRGSDLVGRDGLAAAKMLQGLLACGLGRQVSSVTDLVDDLGRREAALSHQMKFLWDKVMWLYQWIMELRPTGDAKFKFPDPIQDTLARIQGMCENFALAANGGGGWEVFGGADMFKRDAAVVSGKWRNWSVEEYEAELEVWDPSWDFRAEWEKKYAVEKALYTWIDFFEVDDAFLGDLTEKQLYLLAKDLVFLKYKINPHSENFSVYDDPDTGFLDGVFGTRACEVRTNPQAIYKIAKRDIGLVDEVLIEWVQAFLRASIQMKPAEGTWPGASSFTPPPGKTVKTALQERLTELNLKFSPGTTINALKEMLWRHQNNRTVCDNYRDGRASPDRHRDVEAAISPGGSATKQIDATNEELKRTMVHLSKTMEDLSATRMEARFVPRYSSLARPQADVNREMQKKSCASCSTHFTSAEHAFLVVACGHFLCEDCRFKTSFYCPVSACPAFISKRPVLRCSEIPYPPSTPTHPKVQAITCLITDEIPPTERVLVFAQHRPLIDALACSFDAANLALLNLATAHDSTIAAELEKFKDAKSMHRVLLLDMDSETSAGANLTVARHVVFASPYVHPDPEHQLRTVRQARGRSVRTGQDKNVRVYYFVVEGTVEEENLRGMRRSVRRWGDILRRGEREGAVVVG
ncbi:hypothetical protein N0V88_007774 [Collariella sp. IMI 366227]|nr:hypothetical protein N0V88_007774 [Collariella sp. IMI 366227]